VEAETDAGRKKEETEWEWAGEEEGGGEEG
jgi:hypothetical protein